MTASEESRMANEPVTSLISSLVQHIRLSNVVHSQIVHRASNSSLENHALVALGPIQRHKMIRPAHRQLTQEVKGIANISVPGQQTDHVK